MKKTFFLAFFLGIYGVSEAQTVKFVTLPNKQLVPCDHPLAISAGLGCSANTEVLDYDCSGNINPYSEPDRAAFCSAKSLKSVRVANDYSIGNKFADPYSRLMVVIGTTRDIFNRPVVTYQFYTGSQMNEVHSFIPGYDETPWTRVE